MYRNQKKFSNTQKLVLTESLLFRQVESKEEKSHIWLEGHWAETGRVSRTASWDVQSSMMKVMMMMMVVLCEQND